MAVIAGVEDIDPQVIQVTRAFLDFIYMAQYPLQSEDTLHDMSTQLNIIHDNISVFIELGAHGDMDHLNIPKLYSLPRSIDNARYNGVSLNFMTETAESLHIPMCKDLYNASNRRQYEVQMLRLLNMHERVQFQSTYVAWVQENWDHEHEDLGNSDSDSDDPTSDECDDPDGGYNGTMTHAGTGNAAILPAPVGSLAMHQAGHIKIAQ